ncbi:MAG: TIGR03546 family protein [Candidatus Marinimicrobia bacterium]|nr:TIGR03546 family protein [Candidatus Neomarinimicrobiota bacterium]
MLKMIAKLLKVLNSETDPMQISLALGFAMVAGLTPVGSLHNLLILFLVLFLRVNLVTFVLGFGFFSGIAFLLDPVFHLIGREILTWSSLNGFWTALYNTTFWKLERGYNTIVAGSLLISLIFFFPVVVFSRIGINKYRDHILKWVQKTRLLKLLKANKLYRVYQSLSGVGGGS